MLSRPLDELGWSVRLEKAFDTLGVKTVGELARRNEKELLEIKNLGPTSIEEVRAKLAALGLAMVTD